MWTWTVENKYMASVKKCDKGKPRKRPTCRLVREQRIKPLHRSTARVIIPRDKGHKRRRGKVSEYATRDEEGEKWSEKCVFTFS